MLVTACKSDAKKAPTKPSSSQLYTAAEIETFEQELTARLDANAKRTCPRPLLRGAPRPGPASDDIIALVEPKGPLAACLDKVAAAQTTGKLEDQIEQRAPAILAIDQECGELVATTFSNIAAHEDGCSPYQPGRRPETAKPLRPIHAAHMLGLRARIVADKDPAAALWLLATGLRALQDIGRGHVNLVTSLTVAAGYNALLVQVEKIVDTATLAPDAATALAAAFDALIAGEPRFADTLQGEADWKGLYGGLMRYMPATWAPPGGVPDPDPRKHGMPALAKGTRLDARDSGGLVLDSAREVAASLAQACPATASYKMCRDGLELRAAKRATVARRPEALIDPVAVATKLASSGKPAEEIRQDARRLALDTLEPGLHFDYMSYLDKKAQIVWRLVAAQIALATRAATCKPAQPTQAASDLFGDAFHVELDAGVQRVTPPGFARPGGAQWKSKCQ